MLYRAQKRLSTNSSASRSLVCFRSTGALPFFGRARGATLMLPRRLPSAGNCAKWRPSLPPFTLAARSAANGSRRGFTLSLLRCLPAIDPPRLRSRVRILIPIASSSGHFRRRCGLSFVLRLRDTKTNRTAPYCVTPAQAT